jgi:uncharacterized protein
MMQTNEVIRAAVLRWLNEVVIGLNLCPFARKPASENRVRLVVSEAKDDEALLEDLAREMTLLDAAPLAELETTLVIIPQHLQDFFDYTQLLSWAQQMLKRNGWLGVYQLASFHPNYCFAGADTDDVENLTNRSPYPIVHIIREASLEKALAYFPDVDMVPENNQRRMAELSAAAQKKLFPYLFMG